MSRTLNRAFEVERQLHSIGHGEHAIPLPGPVAHIAAATFGATLLAWGAFLSALGLPFEPVIPAVIYLAPPVLAARLSTTPVADSRRPASWLRVHAVYLLSRRAPLRRIDRRKALDAGWSRG